MRRDRLDLYRQLEEQRGSKLLVYVTSTRQGLETQIANDILPKVAEHLDKIGDTEKISLYLYTNGGNTLTAWSLVNLIRSFCEKFEVIIPSNCFSSGTLICLGANTLVMTKQATLGPIDPSINGPLNPMIPGINDPNAKVPVSVEFVNAYIEMAKRDFGITDQRNMTDILLHLSEKIHPLTLGQVYKSKSQIQMLARKLMKWQDLGEEKENAIIKNLKSVEALGCVGVICSDKTGTLTQNKMTVKKVYVSGRVLEDSGLDSTRLAEDIILKESVLCNDATTEVGDPTEIALINLAEKYSVGYKELKEKYPRISEIPFDSDRKLMSTVHEIDDKIIMFTKGALDSLLPRLKSIIHGSEIREITPEDIKEIENINTMFAETGLRVLTYAYKVLECEKDICHDDENGYIFVGLVGMIDPPRVESKEAVEKCIMAGIKPVMITGDHKVTARTIAKEIGIYQEGDNVLEGVEVEKMSDEELKEKVAHTSVYARVSPEHKIRIVTAWQSLGKICAMTGDGVNDAPALKRADIGIAMGITGTEVSKDAASMILADDNFSTIVKAVTTGRNIYANIKNSIRFLLSGNTAAILAVIYSSFAGLPVIFAPVHLLFINLLTDSLPAIAIGMEPSHGEVLKEKPRDPKEPILTQALSSRILGEGLLIAIFVMAGFYLGYGEMKDALKGSTMAFAVLCLARLFHGFNCRGNSSIFGLGFMSNPFSVVAFLIGFVLLSGVLMIPALHGVFEVAPLGMNDLLAIYGLAFIPTVIIQAAKYFKYKR